MASATGRTNFTKRLQTLLATGLRREVHIQGFDVQKEVAPFPEWPAGCRCDVAVTAPGSTSAVILEIEHWSNPAQARANVHQAIAWVRAQKRARVAFVHYINNRGNVQYEDVFRVAGECRSDRWWYHQAIYEHDRADMESSPREYAESFLSGDGWAVIEAAMAFAFGE